MFLRAALRAALFETSVHAKHRRFGRGVLCSRCRAEFTAPARRFGRVFAAGCVTETRTPGRLSSSSRTVATSAGDKVVGSPFNDVEVPDMSLTEFVWEKVDQWPEKTAIVCGVTGRSYTYAQLRERCHRFGCALRKLSLEPGTVVGVILPNCPDFPVAVLGAVEAGCLVTTTNPAYTAEEIAKQLVDVDPRVVVTSADKVPVLEAAAQLAGRQGYQRPLIVVPDQKVPEGAVSLQSLLDSADGEKLPPMTPQVDRNSPAVILYSSGTTGLPKGVLLSHRNLVAAMKIHSEPNINVLDSTTDSYQDCLPAVLPFFHVYGLVVVLMYSLSLGCKVVSLPKFDPKTFLNTLAIHKASVLYLAPALVMFLSSYPDLTTEHLSSLKYVVSGSAPLGETDTDRFMKKAPPNVKLIQGYGLTETSPVICLSRKNTVKLTSVGPCVPNTQVKVIDLKTGESLGPHQKGEICVRGPQVMLGYHQKPEETFKIMDKEGWLRTGDIAYYDNDKDFYIVDRLKDLIKVKGYQVAPAELEELLRSHAEVLDAAVVGIPDLRTGEAVHAFLHLKSTSAASKALEKNVKSYVASKVVEYKQLSSIIFVSSIPKNAAGKVLRKVLKEQITKNQ